MKTIILLSIVSIALGAPRLDIFGSRVINGRDAERCEFPHQISLQTEGRHLCGGSVLNSEWIVTAAHCDLAPENLLVVKAAITNLSDVGQSRFVTKFIKHPKYEGGANPYDIGLIKLGAPLDIDGVCVKPINLPSKVDYTGKAIISGWGDTNEEYPNHLKTAELTLISDEECRDDLIGLYGDTGSWNAMSNICTGSPNGNEGACSGDSGGPLIQDGELVGIVSWGAIPCGMKRVPSIYTRVSSFLDFISYHIES